MGTTAAKLEALLATKTDIKRAIEAKGQEVGDIPFSQYPAKIDAIMAIPNPSPAIEWKPNPTWWDVERILAEDTEDIGDGGRAILLIDDYGASMRFNQYGDFYKFKTSDGFEYTSDATHTWDKSKDKQSDSGYSTRYIIAYTTKKSKDFSFNLWYFVYTPCLYCIFDRCNFSVLCLNNEYMGPVDGAIDNIKIIGGKIDIDNIDNAFFDNQQINSISLPDTWTNITSLGDAFTYCWNLTSITLPKTWTQINNYNRTFAGCGKLISISLPDTEEEVMHCESMFIDCSKLIHLEMGGNQIINDNLDLGSSSFLSKKSALNIIGSLKDRTGLSPLKLTLSERCFSMLLPTEILIATNKNWTIIKK